MPVHPIFVSGWHSRHVTPETPGTRAANLDIPSRMRIGPLSTSVLN